MLAIFSELLVENVHIFQDPHSQKTAQIGSPLLVSPKRKDRQTYNTLS